ncbi:hypothetical protein G6011_11164 [Alternaria panax]|uniref:Uncharacterized protein n=1 Tax=Alternaria panax TaxID=48097 RepID=A0AAD4NT22_9PLEO|nr:hypothetical protein G6011_11164 [Alternaria panax]
MARTRAIKGRPRPPPRNAIARVTPNRGSTVESLRASMTSIELNETEVEKTSIPRTKRQAPSARGYLRSISGGENNFVNIKQEGEEDIAEDIKVPARPKRHTQQPTPKVSATKRQKTSPPSSAIRTTRSKTFNSRTKPDNDHSDTDTNTNSESERGFNRGHSTISNTKSRRKNAKMHHVNTSLDLLRPYMAFQLSVSGLSGKAYKAAQASMISVLAVAERLEEESNRNLARLHDSLGSNSAEEGDIRMHRENEAAGREMKAGKSTRRTEEDVLPRKQQELKEQTRKRLEQERERKRRGGQGQSEEERDSTTCPSLISSSSSNTATEMASDTADEAKYPPDKFLSVSSATSSYKSLHRSTNSGGTSS